MKKDQKWLLKYAQENPWGMTVAVDLKECDPKLIRSKTAIKQFVDQLCSLIKMRKYGQTQVVNFGDDPRVSGFSMTQLIETSLISGHFANQSHSVYLDIFSCKAFPPYQAADFAKNFFKGKKMERPKF